MENTAKSSAINGREDISQFIVHLTRDNRNSSENGNTAVDNLKSILNSETIRATQPHCLFNKKLDHLSDQDREKLNVACFTEVPLNQLHLLTREIPGRQIKLEPYGLVFNKNFIVKSGGQPAIYINSYNQNLELRKAVDTLFEISYKNGEFIGNLWRLLPFINAMNENYDFSWEREWRINQNLEFNLSDIVCLILPSEAEDMQKTCANYGVTFISPGWSYEQIVTQLAHQQRDTHTILDNKIQKLQTSSK
jgi:hypothetical protein